MQKPRLFILPFVALLAQASAPPATPDETPYRILRDAYAVGDAVKASEAYADDASYSEHYPGTAPVMRIGRTEIGAGFTQLFDQLGKPSIERPVTLNFRVVSRQAGSTGQADTGFYRLVVGTGDDADSYYGAFSTLVRNGRFVADTSSMATLADFEKAAGPVMFAADDEQLNATFYDQHVGLYQDRDCAVVVTRSAWRLFALDECSGEWRGLERVDGLSWYAGDRVIDRNGALAYKFDLSQKAGLSIGTTPARSLEKQSAYTVTNVRFGPGLELAGSVYRPNGGNAKRPGVVMLHGSGPQDRNGYASIIALMAQRFARSGVVVLSFDKRGVGGSRGDWTKMGFAELAADARAGLEFLRQQDDVDGSRVGFAGSSQAGWIAAKAIADGGDPAFAMLVGAAGSAMTVREQNLYNTQVLMRCARIAPSAIQLALDQQKAFFDARDNPAKADRLKTLSRKAASVPQLRDWLFPDTVEPSAQTAWYDVLDVDFDPIPIWSRFSGRAFFLFGGQDDSTDSKLSIRRLKAISDVQISHLPGAQHLGLAATSRCNSIEQAQRFDPAFFRTLDQWAREI